jgi:ABC-2 type transport system permease protein
MSLLRAEWRRLFARRFTKIMLVIALGLGAVVLVGFLQDTHRITAADRARAVQLATDERDRELQYMRQECAAAQANPDPNFSAKFPGDCADLKIDQAIHPEYYLPHQFNLANDFENTLIILTIILTLFGFAVAASYVGAEWSSGGMMNLLLWRPTRPAVLGTKLVTALGGMCAVWLGFTALWTGAFWVMADSFGTLGRDTPGFWRSIALTDLRILMLVLVATAIGFALASLGRHTAMALGIGTAYGLLELGSAVFFAILGQHFPERFRLSTYIAAWFNKGITLTDYSNQVCSADFCSPPKVYVITMGGSAALIGGIAVLLIGAAFYAMQSRDVT